LISLEEKQRAHELVRVAMTSGARKKQACAVLGISIRALQRWEQACNPDGRKGAGKKVPRKLSEEERQKVKDTACEAQFKDLTPYEIVAILAENGI
jgi:putative transposase